MEAAKAVKAKAMGVAMRRFENINEALKYFSRKLNSYPLDQVFWDSEVYELFTKHPRFREKTKGMKVVGFIKRRNPMNPRSWTLYAILEDGQEVDFSYRKSVLNMFGNYDKRMNIYYAFRRAIEDQIMEFKKSRMFGNYVITDDGKLLPPEKTHVHHDPPFEVLVERFLSEKKLKLEDIPIKESPDGIQYTIADEALLKEWQEYHRKHAKLILLSKEEHYKVHRVGSRHKPQ